MSRRRLCLIQCKAKGLKLLDFYRLSKGREQLCVSDCVIQRATYPSWHIVCSGGFPWLCHMLHVSRKGLGVGIMQDTLPHSLSLTCKCMMKGTDFGHLQAASFCFITELNELGDGRWVWRDYHHLLGSLVPPKMWILFHDQQDPFEKNKQEKRRLYLHLINGENFLQKSWNIQWFGYE